MAIDRTNLLVKTYKGKEPDARRAFAADAEAMAAQGYTPKWQNYTPGKHGCGTFVLALILCVAVVGIVIFIYLILVPPPGELTVTYEYSPPLMPHQREKTCPKCAESVKAAASVCRFCGHSFAAGE